jgi:hypothetical protein
MKHKKSIFNWYEEEIKKETTTKKASEILKLLITEFLDENQLIIIKRDYIETEITNILWKTAMGKKVTFSYISFIARRLKRNLIKNGNAFYFWKIHVQYNDQMEITNVCPAKDCNIKNHQKKKTYLKKQILEKLEVFYFGCLKDIKGEVI